VAIQISSPATPRIELLAELVEGLFEVFGEEVLDDADLDVVVPRHVDVKVRDNVDGCPLARRAAHRQTERPVTRREQEERRREDRARPFLGVAEEAPRPFAGLDPPGREIAELRLDPVEPRGHEVEEDATLETERRPVEVVVGDEPLVLLPAAAREEDAVDRRVRRPRQAPELAEGRQRHVCLAVRGAGEGEPAGQGVVHGSFLNRPDGR